MNNIDGYKVVCKYLKDKNFRYADKLARRIINKEIKFLNINKIDLASQIISEQKNSLSYKRFPFIQYRLAVYYFLKRKPKDARYHLTICKKLLCPDKLNNKNLYLATIILIVLCNFQTNTGLENENLVNNTISIFPKTCELFLLQALILFQKGEIRKATEKLSLVNKKDKINLQLLPNLLRPCFTVLSYKKSNYNFLLNKFNQINITKDKNFIANNKLQPVHLCSMNAAYFLKFSNLFCISANLVKLNNIIHFHIIDFTEECRIHKQSLTKNFPNLQINYSYSSSNINNPPRSLFAMTRFLILNELFELYKSDIIVSDIDVVITDTSNKIVHFMRENDIGIRIRPHNNYAPWKIYVANLVYFKFCKKILNIVNYMSNYYFYISDNTKHDIWGIDQTCLFYSLYRFNNKLKILDLNMCQHNYLGFLGNNKILSAEQHTLRLKNYKN